MTPLLTAFAVVAFAQEAPEVDFRSHIDQARFFIKRSWFEDARQQLELAVATPDGRIDPNAWYLLATACYELADLPSARDAAERAQTYARDEAQLGKAADLAAFLRQQFGVVHVYGPRSGTNATLEVSLESLLFDPKLKLYFQRVQLNLSKSKVALPHALGLPAGNYAINGALVVVAPGQPVRVDLDAKAARVSGAGALKLAQIEVATGLGLWFGPDLKNLGPGFSTSIAVTQPIGPITLSLAGSWTPQLYEVADGGSAMSAAGWGVGALVGIPIVGLDPIFFRLSLGYYFRGVPGVELGCSAPNGVDWTCSPDGSPDLMVYAVGQAHVPTFEASVDYLRHGQGLSAGIGLNVGVDQAFGSVPKEATASMLGSDGTVDYVVPDGDRAWTATGLRILAKLTLAF